MTIAAVILAAGRGSRAAAAAGVPKQYARIGGETILARTVRAFAEHPEIDLVQVVIHPDDADACAAAIGTPAGKVLAPVHGGATRQASGLRGLEALKDHRPRGVLIHDAARPFVSDAILTSVIAALQQTAGAIPGLAVTDTLKRTNGDGTIAGTVERAGLWRAQTPQAFRYDDVLAAHRKAAGAGIDTFTDDAALAEWAGLPVAVVAGSDRNTKITTPEDLEMAEQALKRGIAPLVDVRTGSGFDVHRFDAGDHVWLCGVRIPHTHKLEGHSDADVALHALTDALLGAIGDGDIGQHFPPSDMQWKGAASHIFVADAVRRVHARGGRITNVDVTILCEAPRVGPHRDAMCAAIAAMLGIERDRVNVKATTTEKLGFTGRREGIAAMATATVILG